MAMAPSKRPWNYGVPCCSASVAVGDFNGDGRPDLVVAGNGGESGGVAVLLGDGDGTFQSPLGYAAGKTPEAAALGDFNGDGRLDVVVATAWSENNSFNLLLNVGNSSFTLSLKEAGTAWGL